MNGKLIQKRNFVIFVLQGVRTDTQIFPEEDRCYSWSGWIINTHSSRGNDAWIAKVAIFMLVGVGTDAWISSEEDRSEIWNWMDRKRCAFMRTKMKSVGSFMSMEVPVAWRWGCGSGVQRDAAAWNELRKGTYCVTSYWNSKKGLKGYVGKRFDGRAVDPQLQLTTSVRKEWIVAEWRTNWPHILPLWRWVKLLSRGGSNHTGGSTMTEIARNLLMMNVDLCHVSKTADYSFWLTGLVSWVMEMEWTVFDRCLERLWI